VVPPPTTGWVVGETVAVVWPLADAVVTGLFVCAASIPQFDTSCEAISVKKTKLKCEASFFIQLPPSVERVLKYCPTESAPRRRPTPLARLCPSAGAAVRLE